MEKDKSQKGSSENEEAEEKSAAGDEKPAFFRTKPLPEGEDVKRPPGDEKTGVGDGAGKDRVTSGGTLLEAAQSYLRSQGIDENTILSEGGGGEQQWWQCKRCKAYIDALQTIDLPDGRKVQYIENEERIRCPSCGYRNLDTVEGEWFDPKLPKVKAQFSAVADEDFLDLMKEAKAIIDDIGLFPEGSDEGDKTEHARVLAVCTVITGGLLYLGTKVKEAAEAGGEVYEGECGDCGFYHPDLPAGVIVDYGTCRRRAPMGRPGQNSWPHTNLSDGCGEGKAKQETPAPEGEEGKP